MTTTNDRDRLRTLLLERSVRRGDFVLASGQRSSVYVDARRTTMSAAGAGLIGALAFERFAARGWKPELVGGLTLGADPVAMAIVSAAHTRGATLDAFSVRKQAKDHGTQQRIEGCFAAGAAVVVVEDVLTTGRSAQEALRAVSDAGGRVLGVLAVVDREQGGRAAIEGAGYALEALLTAHELGLH